MKVKLGGHYFYVSKNLKIYKIYCLTLFNRISHYAKISLPICYFLYRKIYLLKCYENFMIVS
jgi:hypothetical protein